MWYQDRNHLGRILCIFALLLDYNPLIRFSLFVEMKFHCLMYYKSQTRKRDRKSNIHLINERAYLNEIGKGAESHPTLIIDFSVQLNSLSWDVAAFVEKSSNSNRSSGETAEAEADLGFQRLHRNLHMSRKMCDIPRVHSAMHF